MKEARVRSENMIKSGMMRGQRRWVILPVPEFNVFGEDGV